jgi:outer membrane biosynthesis protein TonB
MNRSYLVKVAAGESGTTRVWNTKKPMTVGGPVRWVIEQEEGGVRVRSIAAPGTLPKKSVEDLFLKHSEIEKSASVCLTPGARPSDEFRIEFRPLETLEPAFSKAGSEGSSLRVFYCKKDWAIESFVLGDSCYAVENKKKIFKLKGNPSGIYAETDTVEVHALVDGITITTGKKSEAIAKGAKHRISFGSIADSALAFEGSGWKFARFQKSDISSIVAGPLAADAETKFIQKILKGAAAACVVLGLFTWLMPSKPPVAKEEKVQILLKKKVVAGLMTAAPKGDPNARDFSIGKSGSAKSAGRKGTPGAADTKKIAPAGKEQLKRYAQESAKAQSSAKKTAAPKKSAPPIVAKAAPKAAPKKAASRSSTTMAAAKPTKQKSGARRSSVAAALPKSELFKTLSSSSFKSAARGLVAGGVSGGAANSSDSYASARDMGSSGGGTGNGSLGGAGGVSTRSAEVAGFGGGAGNGDGGPGSAGAGYGRGSHAKVSGQGKSFVSLDTGASDVEEGLTRDQVGRVIHAHFKEIRYCYESATLRSPNVQGTLSLNFSVGSSGSVQAANGGGSTGDARLQNCIVSRLKGWKFPKPKGGVTVAVSYPLFFKGIER